MASDAIAFVPAVDLPLVDLMDFSIGSFVAQQDKGHAIVNLTENLSYDGFVNAPPPQHSGLLPYGESKGVLRSRAS